MESFDGFLVQLAVERSSTIKGTNRNRQMVGKNADQRARFSRKAWKKGWTPGLQSRQMSDREGSIKNARSFFPYGSPTHIYIYILSAHFSVKMYWSRLWTEGVSMNGWDFCIKDFLPIL